MTIAQALYIVNTPAVSSLVNLKCFCERSRAVAVASFLLHLTEHIRQAVEKILKFCSNLTKTFWVDLKAFWGLILPNQYCHVIVRNN